MEKLTVTAQPIDHFQYTINHIYDNNGKKQSIDNLINGPDASIKWLPALSNEWG